jgi:hypothetical protein
MNDTSAAELSSRLTVRMTLNRELLLQVRDFILAEPTHFDIRAWYSDSEGRWPFQSDFREEHFDSFVGRHAAEEGCQTTACIAGAALALRPNAEGSGLHSENIAWRAKSLLGLEGEALFDRDSWPEHYRSDEDLSGRMNAPALIDDMLAGTVILSDNDYEHTMTEEEADFWREFDPEAKAS